MGAFYEPIRASLRKYSDTASVSLALIRFEEGSGFREPMTGSAIALT